MKLMFVSDIHGSEEKLNIVRDIFFDEKPNKIFFLGDLFYGYDSSDIVEIYRSFPHAFFIRGNCDRDLDVEESGLGFMNYYCFKEFNKTFFCTHGHIYNYPQEDFDIFVNGHTHIGSIEKIGDKYFLNPGSISFPRGGSRNSYMIIDDYGIYLKALDETILKQLLW